MSEKKISQFFTDPDVGQVPSCLPLTGVPGEKQHRLLSCATLKKVRQFFERISVIH